MLNIKENLLRMGLSVAAVVLILDQLTKWLSTMYLSMSSSYTLFPGFDLTLRHNTGAAFSFLADAAGWQRWFFVILALVVSIIIITWLKQLNKAQKMEGLGLALILGGAIGNLIDRLLNGYVIDFIVLYYKEWQWPAFNIADTAICVGVFLFIVGMIKDGGKTS